MWLKYDSFFWLFFLQHKPVNDKPEFKPCPTDTDRVIFKRKPSDLTGDYAAAVDISCIGANDDGHCCKYQDGMIAGWNGDRLCYDIPDVWSSKWKKKKKSFLNFYFYNSNILILYL